MFIPNELRTDITQLINGRDGAELLAPLTCA
jgi:hypothetical protein